jgi:hypothetical protein
MQALSSTIRKKITSPGGLLYVFAGLVLLCTISITSPKAYAAPATQAKPAASKNAADCNKDQTAVKIDSGPNRGKWYCRDKNPAPTKGGTAPQGTDRTGKTCGGPDSNYYTPSIDIGCRGRGNPIADALFGIIRFLSAGVGLVIVGSIIVGGIQYTGSRGEPQATAMAVNRIRSSLYALLIYIFAFAILNYLIPAGFLN